MRGRPFEPGNQYGRGRPPGSRNKVASALEETLQSHAETLGKKCVYLALQGNTTALRLCFERLTPARRQRVLRFKLPALKTMADLAAGSETVVKGVARGQFTPAEGQMIAAILEGRRRVIETEELELRLQALESGLSGRQPRGPERERGQREPPASDAHSTAMSPPVEQAHKRQ